jgi:hypothetical protein
MPFQSCQDFDTNLPLSFRRHPPHLESGWTSANSYRKGSGIRDVLSKFDLVFRNVVEEVKHRLTSIDFEQTHDAFHSKSGNI